MVLEWIDEFLVVCIIDMINAGGRSNDESCALSLCYLANISIYVPMQLIEIIWLSTLCVRPDITIEYPVQYWR